MEEAPQQARVASRLLEFVFALLRHHGVDPRALATDLPSFGTDEQLPAWVSWDDYLTMIDRLTEVVGGPEGIGRGMRATLDTAYSELRALAGFFAGPVPFFSFVTHHLMRELCTGAIGHVDVIGENRLRLRYTIPDAFRGSVNYHHGTIALVEVFPTHFGLPEAKVEVVSMTERAVELIADFPPVTRATKVTLPWGELLPPPVPSPEPVPPPPPRPSVPVSRVAKNGALTPREQEVLRYVCGGLTNAEIATALGTSPSTVKTQISSILTKMDAANRTELASRAARLEKS